MSGLIMLAAGGTGGHLFPAQALAEELVTRGYRTQLVTDERVRDYGKSFPAEKTHIIHAATLTPKKPWKVPGQAWTIYRAFGKSKAVFNAEKPQAVVGFGGYPSFAPLKTAAELGIASVIHEQNAVLGRANGALAAKVDALASSFSTVSNLKPEAQAKLTFTGNPVRAIVLKEQASAYPPLRPDQPLKLVVFGGSQGARFFSTFMPSVFQELDPALRKRIQLVQQCRAEDLEQARQQYANFEMQAELEPFFADMPRRIAQGHLVISRSGASTIAELGVIGRPAIMVPLPGAIDNDQLRNAESFAAAGAGWLKPQAGLQAKEFAGFLESLLKGGLTLPSAAAKALTHGKPDAAKRLADLVIKTIADKSANTTR